MAEIPFDLSRYADTLGDVNDYFVDEHAGDCRVVRHADGAVVGLLRPDGAIAPHVQAPNPEAPPVTGTLNIEADEATFKA